jgi:hypothetical protein
MRLFNWSRKPSPKLISCEMFEIKEGWFQLNEEFLLQVPRGYQMHMFRIVCFDPSVIAIAHGINEDLRAKFNTRLPIAKNPYGMRTNDIRLAESMVESVWMLAWKAGKTKSSEALYGSASTVCRTDTYFWLAAKSEVVTEINKLIDMINKKAISPNRY